MESKFTDLDPIIHSRVRLAIMILLLQISSAEFTYIKKEIGVSDGNLSTHLKKLEEVKYIKIKKRFKHKKPQTIISLTDKGRSGLKEYTANLEVFLQLAAKHGN